MDFLKTLLAYMTLLAALGVQEGPAPDTVPTPTPLPVHMTATPVPNQTEAPTATPSPTSVPVPTITPNNRYAKIVFGDSGNNVKKLQNALIDLGFMPKGSADGSYGYQTYNAVKAFQKANGLEVDGVAGPATLTNLYENPNVVGVVEETPVPTATASPTLPPLSTLNSPNRVLTLLDSGYIISGTDGKTLYRNAIVDGQAALVKPSLWVDETGVAVLSLAELADCLEGWKLMGSSADGLYALTASGYTVNIDVMNGPAMLVDDTEVSVSADDVFIQNGTLYVTDAFLRAALKAETVFDVDEKSLVVFFKDKSVANAQD